MPATYEWLDEEQTVVLTVLSGEWTWADFEAISRRYKVDLQQITHPVYEIVYFVDGDRYWLPPNPLRYGRSVVATQPPNVVMSILVSSSTYIRSLIGIYNRLNGRGYRMEYAHTVAHARAIIAVEKRAMHQRTSP